jgi:AcrR family transcriptional regulator
VARLSATLSVASSDPPAQRDWRKDVDPRGLPPTDRSSDGQRRVLGACVELFAAQGYAATSIRDIASAAGLQPASLYNHFSSKDAMLTELVLLGFDQHLQRVISAALNAPSEPREQLREAVHAHVMVHCEYPNLALVVNHERRHLPAEIKAQSRAISDRAAGLINEILSRGASDGSFALRAQRVTLFALSSMGVDAARWFPYQHDIDAEQLCNEYAELALRMVGV